MSKISAVHSAVVLHLLRTSPLLTTKLWVSGQVEPFFLSSMFAVGPPSALIFVENERNKLNRFFFNCGLFRTTTTRLLVSHNKRGP